MGDKTNKNREVRDFSTFCFYRLFSEQPQLLLVFSFGLGRYGLFFATLGQIRPEPTA